MASENLNECIAEILRHEGGYVDHSKDPGGATNMGITLKTLARWRSTSPWWKLPKSAVKKLQLREAKAIYEAKYWNPVAGNLLPSGLDLALFDFAVNSGPIRAICQLQGLLTVRCDGVIGPVTIAALKRKIADEGSAVLIQALCQNRLSFLQRLATFAIFGKGWRRRVVRVEAKALRLAHVQSNSNVKKRNVDMNIFSGYKTYVVGAFMLLAGFAQSMGIDLPGFDGQTAGQLIIEGFAIVFLRKGMSSEIGNA